MNNVLVEEQNWFQKNSVNRLFGANLTTFSLHPQNAAIVIQSASLTSEKYSGTFNGSFINSSGSFTIPAQFKTVLTFNSYDLTTAKLLQSTGRDGLQNQYVWDHNNTLIKTSTTIGGTLQLATNFVYRPLVGITKETDVNGLSAYKEFDALGRVHLAKDNDGNILSRYRYHFKGETASFVLSASKLQANVNESISFSVSDVFASTGGSTHLSWNMGDGRTYTDNRTSVTLSYPSPGSYTVNVTLSSTEYPPVTKSLLIKINKPLQVSVCVDGPQEVDICTGEVIVYGSCTASNNTAYSNIELVATPVVGTGCTGAYTYKWEYKLSTSSYWYSLGTSQRVLFAYRQVGDYQVRCTLTDACNKTAVGQQGIYFFEGQPNCSISFQPLISLEQPGLEDSVSGMEVIESAGHEETPDGDRLPLPLPTGVPYGVFATPDKTGEN